MASATKQMLERRRNELRKQLADYEPIKAELEEVERALEALEPKRCTGCAGCDECRCGPYYR